MGAHPIVTQVSAGGVVFRKSNGAVEIALIKTSFQGRWQLPKGGQKPGEDLPEAALREVREETGIVSDLLQPIQRIEYWFAAGQGSKRTRCHKYVSFFLMKYRSGDVCDHDDEVIEARWVEIGAALKLLSFASERQVVEIAQQAIRANEPDANTQANNAETLF
jgi:8-oxo-dGTP diphosphatase